MWLKVEQRHSSRCARFRPQGTERKQHSCVGSHGGHLSRSGWTRGPGRMREVGGEVRFWMYLQIWEIRGEGARWPETSNLSI